MYLYVYVWVTKVEKGSQERRKRACREGERHHWGREQMRTEHIDRNEDSTMKPVTLYANLKLK